MNKDKWTQKLSEVDGKYNFPCGYKLLYSPWETINMAKIAFISLNPGKLPDGAELRVVSDERGNSYEVEEKTTKSPITHQFLELCKFLKTSPNNILTGTACPFRGKGWNTFNNEQKRAGLALGKEFWSEALKCIDLIITVGNETADLIIQLINAEKVLEINSGWGGAKLRKYKNNDNKVVIHLPHLSRFRLFSRQECIQPLEIIFE